MRLLSPACLAAAVVVLSVASSAASAKEKLLTLYSPRIESMPYVHDTHEVSLLKAEGNAPSEPGYILGYKEMARSTPRTPSQAPADCEDDGPSLPLLGSGRVNETVGSCWRGAGIIGGRGEEHPLGRTRMSLPKRSRGTYGTENRRGRHGSRLAPHRDGDGPLQAAQELLRAHESLVYDREAQAGDADGDRQLRPAAQRNVV